MGGVLDYFTLNSWNWSNDNLLALHEAMQPEDKEVFYFDPRVIEWNKYVLDYAKGVKSFVLKENIDDMSKARSRMNKLIFFNMCVKVMSYIIGLKILIAKSDAIKAWLMSILGYIRKRLIAAQLISV